MSNVRHILSTDEAWLLEVLFWLRPVALRVAPALANVAHSLVQRELVRFERGGMAITAAGIDAHRAHCARERPSAARSVLELRRTP